MGFWLARLIVVVLPSPGDYYVASEAVYEKPRIIVIERYMLGKAAGGLSGERELGRRVILRNIHVIVLSLVPILYVFSLLLGVRCSTRREVVSVMSVIGATSLFLPPLFNNGNPIGNSLDFRNVLLLLASCLLPLLAAALCFAIVVVVAASLHDGGANIHREQLGKIGPSRQALETTPFSSWCSAKGLLSRYMSFVDSYRPKGRFLIIIVACSASSSCNDFGLGVRDLVLAGSAVHARTETISSPLGAAMSSFLVLLTSCMLLWMQGREHGGGRTCKR